MKKFMRDSSLNYSIKTRNFTSLRAKNKESPLEDLMQKELYRNGNHIYLYDEIDEETQMFIQTEMAAAYKELIAANMEAMSRGEDMADTIFLHINSPGGLVTSSLAIYDYIKNFPIPVVGVVEGLAASGASIILCACAIRQATRHSHVLFHELRGGCVGKYSELMDSFMNDQQFMDELIKLYAKETLIPEEALADVLAHDLYWDTDTCKKLGIIDFVVGEQPDEDELEKRIDERFEGDDNCDCEEDSKKTKKSNKKSEKKTSKKETVKKEEKKTSKKTKKSTDSE